MRRFIITAVIGAAALSAPSSASADWSECSTKLEHKYTTSYNKVVNMHGKRAPGRNIRKMGMRFIWKKGAEPVVFLTTCHELRQSLHQLNELLSAPPYPTLVRSSVLPRQPPAGVNSAGVTAGPLLQAIAQCESGGDPTTNTGNGFYGKYQFTLSTWQSVGGTGLPSDAPEAVQDALAAKLLAQQGTSPWPVCGS